MSVATAVSTDKWLNVPFDEVFIDATSGNIKVKQSDYLQCGRLPVIDQGANEIGGYTDDDSNECRVNLPTILFGDHTKKFQYVEYRFALGADGVKVLSARNGWDMRFLFHFLSGVSLPDVGYSRHFKFLKRISVPKAPLDEQRRIAAILDKADAIRRKRQQALALADDFLRSTFLEMFGDPVTNSKFYPQAPIKSFGNVVTGNTPSRQNKKLYGWDMEWAKSDNINTPDHYLTKAAEGLSKVGMTVGRIVPAGSTLVTCIAGSPSCIGNAALTDRAVAFNQQINAVVPKAGIHPGFIYTQFLVGKKLVQAASTNSMKGMVSKGQFQEILFLHPPVEEQRKFGEIFERCIKAHKKLTKYLQESESLFASLSQRAFCGEL